MDNSFLPMDFKETIKNTGKFPVFSCIILF